MSMVLSEQSLVPLIERTFKEALEQEIEKVADEAAEKARAAVRQRLAPLVMSLFSEYSAYRNGTDLVIKVKINDGGPNDQR